MLGLLSHQALVSLLKARLGYLTQLRDRSPDLETSISFWMEVGLFLISVVATGLFATARRGGIRFAQLAFLLGAASAAVAWTVMPDAETWWQPPWTRQFTAAGLERVLALRIATYLACVAYLHFSKTVRERFSGGNSTFKF